MREKKKTIVANYCINEILFPNILLENAKRDSIKSIGVETKGKSLNDKNSFNAVTVLPVGEQKINDDKNFHYLVSATRKGLPYESLSKALIFMPFDKKEWTKILHISSRTLERLKKDKKKLNSLQTEKLIDVTLLFKYGIDVFGSKEKFSKWLGRESIALGGIEPKKLLDTNQGIKAVETELSRIEYGVLA